MNEHAIEKKDSMIEQSSGIVPYLVAASLLLTGMGWERSESPAVLLDKACHFTTPDGTDILVAAGTYHLEPSTDTQLQLVATSPPLSLDVQAIRTAYEETVEK